MQGFFFSTILLYYVITWCYTSIRLFQKCLVSFVALRLLKILNEIGINKIEWLIDEHYKDNPILNKKKHSEIIKQKKKYRIDIVSICCDNFMFNSFFDD